MTNRKKQVFAHVFSNGVKELRKKLGLTQRELAERANVSERSVRAWENEERTDARGDLALRILRLCPDDESLLAFGIDRKRSPARQ